MSLTRRTTIASLLAVPVLGRRVWGGAAPRPIFSALAGTPQPAAPLAPISGPAVPAQPRWQRYAVTPPPANGKPTITIVIDDMGVMHPGTQRAVALPAPLTLSWFPFARFLPEQVGEASQLGHETTLHMPMQSFGNTIAWTGPDPLRIDHTPEENLRLLVAAIDAVPDTVGLNNHMGSVATRDVAVMDVVAQEALRRDMLFLDSLTIGHSVAYKQAAAAGVPAASRDIFIDDVNNAGMIAAQLEAIEHFARREGNVIAIGHPRTLTLAALEAWLPGLAAKGFVLWPLSATVAARNNITIPV